MYKGVVGMRSTTGVGLCLYCVFCVLHIHMILSDSFFVFLRRVWWEEGVEEEKWQVVVVLHV